MWFCHTRGVCITSWLYIYTTGYTTFRNVLCDWKTSCVILILWSITVYMCMSIRLDELQRCTALVIIMYPLPLVLYSNVVSFHGRTARWIFLPWIIYGTTAIGKPYIFKWPQLSLYVFGVSWDFIHNCAIIGIVSQTHSSGLIKALSVSNELQLSSR